MWKGKIDIVQPSQFLQLLQKFSFVSFSACVHCIASCWIEKRGYDRDGTRTGQDPDDRDGRRHRGCCFMPVIRRLSCGLYLSSLLYEDAKPSCPLFFSRSSYYSLLEEEVGVPCDRSIPRVTPGNIGASCVVVRRDRQNWCRRKKLSDVTRFMSLEEFIFTEAKYALKKCFPFFFLYPIYFFLFVAFHFSFFIYFFFFRKISQFSVFKVQLTNIKRKM